MQADKVQTILEFYKNQIPKDDYYRLEDALFSAPDKDYDKIMNCRMLSVKKFRLVSIFLGLFGVDRFMLNERGLGILKILGNIFFICIPYFVDLHYVIKRVKEINSERLFNYF